MEKKLEGPTSFVTTTTMETLEPQLEDRLFTIHPDESPEQNKKILLHTASEKAGLFTGLAQKKIESWKHFHSSLQPVRVTIPFAPKIGEFITKIGEPPISTRRAFNRVLIVIQSIACGYQHQREEDKEGRIKADMSDYWMALQIVEESFKENMGAPDQKTGKYLEAILEAGKIKPGELTKKFGVAGSSISGWAYKRIQDEILVWCDEAENEFSDDKALKTAKHRGIAYLKASEIYDRGSITGLPTHLTLPGIRSGCLISKIISVYIGSQFPLQDSDE
jgi:DNA primase